MDAGSLCSDKGAEEVSQLCECRLALSSIQVVYHNLDTKSIDLRTQTNLPKGCYVKVNESPS